MQPLEAMVLGVIGSDQASVGGFRFIEFGLSFLGLDNEQQFGRGEAEEIIFNGVIGVRVTVLRPAEDFIGGRGEGLELATAREELIRLEGFEVLGNFLDGASDRGAAF
jgi:hypothetical protein